MSRNADEADAGALGYKTLFLGACGIITLLVPGIVGYVVSDINDTNKVQWRQIKELNDEHQELQSAYIRLQMEQGACRKDIDELRSQQLRRREGL